MLKTQTMYQPKLFNPEDQAPQMMVEEMPIQKLYAKGKMAMTDADILATVIGGNQTKALEKARLLLGRSGGIWELGKMNRAEIQRDGNLTKAESAAVLCALELGRRRSIADIKERPKITSSRDVFNCIAGLLNDLVHEEFWVLLVNKAKEVVSRHRISSGGTAGTVVDLKLVMKICIEEKAAAFIAVHNHPSGNLQPSQADIDLTRRLSKGGDILDIKMLDHLIVSERGYYSFADEGMM